MVHYFKEFLASPVFEQDEDKTNKARVLNSLLVSILIVLGMFVVIDVPFFAVRKLGVLVTIALAVALLLFVRFLMSRGQVRLASICFLTGAWLIFTAIVFLSGGIASITPIFFLVTTVLAGLLLGQEAAIGVAVASSVTTLGMIVMEIMGYPPPRYFPMPVIPAWITLTFSLAITIIPLNLTLRTRSQALALAHQELAERKATEASLRASEERYRIITELISDYAYAHRVEPDGSFTFEWITSDSARRMTGYDPLQEIGSSFILYHPDDQAKANQHVQETIQGKPTSDDYRIITKAGELRWVHIDRQPVWDPAQQRVVRFYGVSKDITERKRAEEALRASEQKFRTIIEQATEGFVLLDENGTILEWNQAQEDISGLSRIDVIGQPFWDVQFCLTLPERRTPDRLANFKQVTLEALQTGQSPVFNKPLEAVIQTLTGEQKFIQQVIFPVKTEQGFRIGSVIRDITGPKRAEVEREQLIKELEAKNAELERFTYTVSHDLKAPLVTIKGFLGWLQKDLNNQNMARVQADIDRIQAAAEKMHLLLDELLELSRIGRLMSPPENVPFETIVREALALVEGRLAERKVQVEVAKDLPVVSGDRARLVEVVQNLVDNAAKFMGNQSRPRIEIGVREQEGEQIFFVRDNGIGIAPQFHEKVFGLFNKLESQSYGTGIGLALVKRIVEVHGGRIWVESEGAGQGSTFWFSLPAVAQN